MNSIWLKITIGIILLLVIFTIAPGLQFVSFMNTAIPRMLEAKVDIPVVDYNSYHCGREKNATVRFKIKESIFSLPYNGKPLLFLSDDVTLSSSKYHCFERRGDVYDVLMMQNGFDAKRVLGEEGKVRATVKIGVPHSVKRMRIGVKLPRVTDTGISFISTDGILVSISFGSQYPQPAIRKYGEKWALQKAHEFYEALILQP